MEAVSVANESEPSLMLTTRMKTIGKAVSDSVWGPLHNFVQSPVSDAVWDSVSEWDSVRECLGVSIWKFVQNSVWDTVRGLRGSVTDIAGSPIEQRTRELLDENN